MLIIFFVHFPVLVTCLAKQILKGPLQRTDLSQLEEWCLTFHPLALQTQQVNLALILTGRIGLQNCKFARDLTICDYYLEYI
jgi:hypothetical protein